MNLDSDRQYKEITREELKTAGNNNGKPEKVQSTEDGPPDDIRAFYGHPLTAATTAVSEEDRHASAVALLHEYINLPALDKSGMRIGDKINSIYDIIRDDGSSAKAEQDTTTIVHNGDVGEYIELLQTTLSSEVDKFFNNGEITTAILPVAEDTGSLAGEVIQEICVQTSPEEERNVNEEFFTTISDASIIAHGLDAVIDTVVSQSDSVNMTVPVSIAEYPAELANSQSSDIREPVKHEGKRSPVLQDISQQKPSKGRQKPEQKQQQTQEISRKLVKALSEKILRRQMSQQAESNLQKSSASESEMCQMKTTTATASGAVNHGVPNNAIDSRTKYVQNPLFTVQTQNAQTKETLAEKCMVSENLISAKDTLTVAATEPVSLASSAALCHNHNYVPSCTHAQTPVTPEEVQYVLPPTPIQCVPNIHSTAADNSEDPVKFQQYLANCGSAPLTHTNQNTPMTNGDASVTASMPVHDYYPNTTNQYVYQITPPLDTSVDRDILLERYIQQQQQYFQEQMGMQYQAQPMKENYGIKSPDSGYHESCSVSPLEQANMAYKPTEATRATKTAAKRAERAGKIAQRRKSAPTMYVKQYWHPADKNLIPLIPKLEVDPTGYKYFLESPISTTQRIEEDRITYVNKGQYYGLTLEHHGDRQIKSPLVKSLIMVVFREDKHLEDERKAWEFWHSRQHSYKQRVLDIDTKNSIGVGPSNVDEVAHNAVVVKWNPRNSPVRVNIAVHCLSTDFSNQKGVKGLPLHIQIDTFENMKDTLPVSRAFCQIKAFCDKGAERKTRDEERRKTTKVKAEAQAKARKRHDEAFHSALERSEFYAMADLTTQPVLFSPTYEGEESSTRVSPVNLTNDEDSSRISSSEDDAYFPAAKRSRTESWNPNPSNILLYVREKHESVFTALMLRMPTLHGLLMAIEEKYKIPVLKIKNTYKRSKKGILIRLDDNIIRHYSHEATFVIELNCVSEGKDFEVILTEIEVN